METHRTPGHLALTLALCGSVACGKGSGPDTPAGEALFATAASVFAVADVSVAPGEEWRLNRPIDVTFTQDVDFATVSPNTIRIAPIGHAAPAALGSPAHGTTSTAAAPANGTFELVSARVVRFRPSCPTRADLTDAGLQPRLPYNLIVRGANAGSLTVRSTSGEPVAETCKVPFRTPYSSDPARRFDDPVPGPPMPVIRSRGSADLAATYLELGLDDGDRVYFERDRLHAAALPDGFLAPINHYSRTENRVAWVLQLDQPIQPGPENLGPGRVGLEYTSSAGETVRLKTDVELLANCADNGATLRISPRGILPQGSEVRAWLGRGFSDLTGQSLASALDNFARAPTATSFDPGTDTPGDDGDELFETFAVGGASDGSLEDTSFASVLPRARWGDGGLEASAPFDGTGGPGGDFDWCIPDGAVVVLDTTSATIVGGPDCVPVTTQTVIGGVVDVRNLTIPATSTLFVVGPNPLLILASGRVRIDGEISVDGWSNAGVGTLNTTNQPEPGASGRGGGGRGGVGSPLTSQSSPRGGSGAGAFGRADLGGQGGEASFSLLGKNARRGSGGGGGRFGPDVRYDFMGTSVRCQTLIGMDAETGRGGGAAGMGAISQPGRALGGEIGPSPFVGGDPTNDFTGLLLPVGPLAGNEKILGELPHAWGGSGGGAGGDAVNSDEFPPPFFSPTGDEKGAGGGGGAGALTILAMGNIEIGPGGSVHANGGNGGGGENTNFFDRVGGGSGGGSGGHIVLQSASKIVVDAVAPQAGDFYVEPNQGAHEPRPLSALGGQGGAGRDNRGGADQGATSWKCDAIPLEYFEGLPVPPSQETCFNAQPDLNDPLGPTTGAGGDGGPGLIQLHVFDLATDLCFPGIADGDLTKVCAPRPVGWSDDGFFGQMLPDIGARSLAQSKWIALGAAGHDPAGGDEPVRFFFGGLAAGGEVPRNGSVVALQAPVLGPDPLQAAPTLPFVDADGVTLVADATGLAGFDDIYLRNPALLIGSSVRLEQASAPGASRLFDVEAVRLDRPRSELRLTVDGSSGTLLDFAPGGALSAALVPRSFRVVTDGVVDRLPPNTSVRVSFDAAHADELGQPDSTRTYSGRAGSWAPSTDDLTQEDWSFVRFRVQFDVNAAGGAVSVGAPRPSLSFLRVPFRF